MREFNTADLKTDRIVELSVLNNRIAPNAMEMRQIIAMPHPESDETDELLIWCGTQGTVSLSKQIAEALNLDSRKVHLRSGNVGGGFGYKIFLHPEQLCICWAVKKLKKAVKTL